MTVASVSVVIPTRNGSRLLPFTIASVLSQSHNDLELIVVDDGSTDETPNVLATLADPRVTVVRHESSRGVAAARNRGIAEAGGEWLAFLDHDDLWAPQKLAVQLQRVTEESASFAYGSAVYVDEAVAVTRLVPAPRPAQLAPELARRNVMPAGQSNVLARRELVARLGGFDEELVVVADWDMWIRMAAAGRGAAVDDVLVAYRVQAGSMTTSDLDCDPDIEYLSNKFGPDQFARREASVFTDRWLAYAHRQNGRRALAARQYLRSAVRERDLGMGVRGIGVLFGERAMALGHLADRRQPTVDPPWLERYRGSTHGVD